MAENKTEMKAGLSFCLRRGRLLIHHATIKALDEPEYIRFLLNEKEKCIAIQSCEAIDRDRFKVPIWREGTKDSFEITSIPFLTLIYKRCEWEPNKSFLVYGNVYPKHRLVEFDLRTSVEINVDQFVDPENGRPE